MGALNILPADAYPRVTEEIPAIIELVKGLAAGGFAYAAEGSVYFRVRRLSDYGKLSHRTLEQMQAGARIEVDASKEDPMDFVLWKASKPGEPAWDSPWGPGRPGWHIECSAMSRKYLGETIDIHGGGADLIFPHHENEIAQSESFSGKKPFVRYWMHNGLLQLGGEKMSKSLGNLITVKEALAKYSADALRVFVLSSHYRSPLTYSDEIIEGAEKGARRLAQAAGEGTAADADEAFDGAGYRDRFTEAMDDDFNTPRALAALFDLARDINRLEAEGRPTGSARALLRELGGVLGLRLEAPAAGGEDHAGVLAAAAEIWASAGRAPADWGDAPDRAMADILTLRAELRREKNYAKADKLRNRLDEAGVVIKDTPTGPVWSYKVR
jgi:cysteinyl-tRNA synthetase